MNDAVTSIARRDGPRRVTERARKDYDDKQIELIRATVAKDCSPAELHLFLEVAAKYDLDPFTHEIYAAKMGREGSPGQVVCIVARDGLLKIARRTGEFRGIRGDVVHENDTFTKDSDVDLPVHSYKGYKDRGEIIGAWSVVYREGCDPTYFFAPWEEYVPTGRKLQFSPWSSQKSAMILKCAEAMALRKAFSITGVVGEEEMARSTGREIEAQSEIDWGSEPTLRAWLMKLFSDINAVRPNRYREAKIRTLLKGRTDEEREVFAGELVKELVELECTPPERPTVEQLAEQQEEAERLAAEARGEVVHDAELVTDDVDDKEYKPSDPTEDIPFPGTEPDAANEG